MRWRAEVERIASVSQSFYVEAEDYEGAEVAARVASCETAWNMNEADDVQYNIMELVQLPVFKRKAVNVTGDQVQELIDTLAAIQVHKDVLGTRMADRIDAALRNLAAEPTPLTSETATYLTSHVDVDGKLLPSRLYQPDVEKWNHRIPGHHVFSSIEKGLKMYKYVPVGDWVCLAAWEIEGAKLID